jgi:hypothetical protein
MVWRRYHSFLVKLGFDERVELSLLGTFGGKFLHFESQRILIGYVVNLFSLQILLFISEFMDRRKIDL